MTRIDVSSRSALMFGSAALVLAGCALPPQDDGASDAVGRGSAALRSELISVGDETGGSPVSVPSTGGGAAPTSTSTTSTPPVPAPLPACPANHIALRREATSFLALFRDRGDISDVELMFGSWNAAAKEVLSTRKQFSPWSTSTATPCAIAGAPLRVPTYTFRAEGECTSKLHRAIVALKDESANPFLIISSTRRQQQIFGETRDITCDICIDTVVIDPTTPQFNQAPASAYTAQATVPGAVDYDNPGVAITASSMPPLAPGAWWSGGGFVAGTPCADGPAIVPGYVQNPPKSIRKQLGALRFQCR